VWPADPVAAAASSTWTSQTAAPGTQTKLECRRPGCAEAFTALKDKPSKRSWLLPTTHTAAATRSATTSPSTTARPYPPRGNAVLLKAWAHASSKSVRFGLQELVGPPHSTLWPDFQYKRFATGFARIALVKFISQEASRGGAECECKRTRLHAVDLRFRVCQQPHVSNAARSLH